MAKIQGLWRFNKTIVVSEDTEYITIAGPFVINTQEYLNGLVHKDKDTQVITIEIYPTATETITIYSSDTGWVNYFLRVWEYKNEVELSDRASTFFAANTEELEPIAAVDVNYDGEKLLTVPAGKSAALHCLNKVMMSDLTITAAPLMDQEATPNEETQKFFVPFGYGGFDTLTVHPIPEEYLVPEGSLEITENKTQDVTEIKEVIVNVPIPEGYLKPEGHLELEENVEKMDISKYEFLTVNAMKSIIGKEYSCIAGATVELGNFVEFVINYGQGEFSNQTVSDIHLYPVDQEKILIDYQIANGQRQIVGLYLTGNIFHISSPLTYGVEGASQYGLTVLNSNTAVCLWAVNEDIGGGQNQGAAYIQAIQINTSYDEGIDLTLGASDSIYTTNPGTTIMSAAISKLEYNQVFATLFMEESNGNPIYYSVIKNLSNLGRWSTNIAGDVGYSFSNTKSLIRLGSDKLLYVWLQENTLNCGIMIIDRSTSEFLTYNEQIITIEDVASFIIKELQNGSYFPLLVKTTGDSLAIRTLTIGGTSINLSEPLIVATSVSGAYGLGAVTYYETVVLYPHTEGYLTSQFFQHDYNSVRKFSNADTTSLSNLYVKDTFDLELLSYYNNIVVYIDQTGASKYGSLTTTVTQTGAFQIELKENEAGTYVYPTTSNSAIVGVAITSAEVGEELTVVRPS